MTDVIEAVEPPREIDALFLRTERCKDEKGNDAFRYTFTGFVHGGGYGSVAVVLSPLMAGSLSRDPRTNGFSDDELRRMWSEAGGTMIGPYHHHHASISEARLLAFLHRFAARVRAEDASDAQ